MDGPIDSTQPHTHHDIHSIKPILVDTSFEPHRVGSPASRNSPAYSLPKTPPPKTTIGELLVKDQQPLPVPPPSRCPVVPIQHHVAKTEIRRLPNPEDDGDELERKLAAQRAKKQYASMPSPNSTVIFSSSNDSAETSHSDPKPEVKEPCTEPLPSHPQENIPSKPQNVVEVQAEVHSSSDHTDHKLFRKSPSPLNLRSPAPPSSPPPPPPPPPQLVRNISREGSVDRVKDSLKNTLDPDDLRSLILEEIRSPPPVPPPKPLSRPQSPAIAKVRSTA
ncbi:unnamed protein product [Strongylus vulgaris]|uniref:Uncharacterized protein n=1 Tax=Strongylus vulgaris TaxID=40348 RepID=A0A3P7JCQ8_STRVU|nr:unnamed protein product [Strongylus vulgaris]